MAMLSTGTKMRGARKALRTQAKLARTMPRVNVKSGGGPKLTIPTPDLHLTSPRLDLSIPHIGMPHPRQSRRRRRAMSSLLESAARVAGAAQPKPPRRRRAGQMIAAAGGTAAAVYLLDPDKGRRRRHMARDRGLKLMRQAGRRGSQQARYAAGSASGKVAQMTPSPPKQELNDPALARKVEAEIFREAGAPKGDVDVNVEYGVVYLRGQLDDETVVEQLVTRARMVEGVKDVQSLIHRPDEPAPSKEDALEASGLMGEGAPSAMERQSTTEATTAGEILQPEQPPEQQSGA